MMPECETTPDSSSVVQVSRRLMIDGHGCLLQKKNGPPEYIRSALTDQHFDQLRRFTDNVDIQGLRDLTHIVSRSKPDTYDFRVAHLDQRSNERHREEMMHIRRFIAPYQVLGETKEALARLANAELVKRGARLTVASGAPSCCAYWFKSRLEKDGVWEMTDPDYSVFLRPYSTMPRTDWPDRRTFSPAVKMAALSLCSISDKEKPWVVEDIIEIAEYIAYFYDTRVYIPLSYDEAKRRRKFDLPSCLYRLTGHGEIIFGNTIPEAVEDYISGI